jgi:ribosome-associated protein
VIKIAPNILLHEDELQLTFIRSPGPGGQNVNKVASAVQLRFDVIHSPSLSDHVKTRLLHLAGRKATQQGELIIKANRYRTQETNKQDAIKRLVGLIQQAAIVPKKRKKTKPTFAAKQQRLTEKKLHAKTKSLRRSKLSNEY